MTQMNVCKYIQVNPAYLSYDTAKTNLLTMFKPEFVDIVLSTLNRNEIRILNDHWDQLRSDLQRYEPDTVRIPLFLFHFHNYV